MPLPIPASEIDRSEKVVGYRFPDSYRKFLSVRNGGEISTDYDDWLLFPLQDHTSKETLRRTSNHALYETKKAQEWRGFPHNALAIGSNGEGDLLVFLSDEKQLSGKVYVWRHETARLWEVADDFSEL
jgi:hypothetical protein